MLPDLCYGYNNVLTYNRRGFESHSLQTNIFLFYVLYFLFDISRDHYKASLDET